jgi:hypothetical protein
MKKSFIKNLLLIATLSMPYLNPSALQKVDNNKKVDIKSTAEINQVGSQEINKADSAEPQIEPKDEALYQKIIADFKKYMLTVKPEIKAEIKEFRNKIKDLNKQKQQAYAQLTMEAQQYLKDEKAFKKKLPIHKRKDLVDSAKEKGSPGQ